MRRSHFVRVLVLAGVAALGAAPGETGDAQAPRKPSEVLERDLAPVGANLHNAKVKTERGITGMHRDTTGRADKTVVRGWAATCCEANVREIYAKVESAEKTAAALVKRYRAEHRNDGATACAQILEGLQQTRHAVETFATAADRATAARALDEAVRAFADVGKQHKELERCCDDVTVPVPD
jgi:hypothetical protein